MNKKCATLLESFYVIAIITVLLLIPILAIWTDRNLDFWLTYFKGVPVNVPYWLSLFITIIGNGFILAANIIAEICRYFVGS